jgi:hypothetical protein
MDNNNYNNYSNNNNSYTTGNYTVHPFDMKFLIYIEVGSFILILFLLNIMIETIMTTNNNISFACIISILAFYLFLAMNYSYF